MIESVENFRKSASERFGKLFDPAVLPGPKDDRFRYARLRNLKITPSEPENLELQPGSYSGASEFAGDGDFAFTLIMDSKGRFSLNSLGNNLGPERGSEHGLVVTTLSEFVKDPTLVPKSVRTVFQDSIEGSDVFSDDLFAQLNLSRWRNGALVYVPDGCILDRPLRIIHHYNEQDPEFYPRTILVADEGSRCHVFEEFTGKGYLNGKAPFASSLTSVIAREKSQVRISQFQNWGTQVQSFARGEFRAEAAASIDVISASCGSSYSQFRSELLPVGERASITLKGAHRGDDSQTFDSWISARHEATDTKSDMKFWTVMADRAKSVFNGNIVIKPTALRTEAYQKNRNMLLSDKASADTFPKLEIATDEVQCAHGATIVPVSEDQVYYLQSRGVPKNEAEQMIVNGFTEPVVQEFPGEATQMRVREALQSKHGFGGEK